MDFNDVLSQRLLSNKHFSALRAWHVADVVVHFDVVIITTTLVRYEAAVFAFQYRHLTVH